MICEIKAILNAKLNYDERKAILLTSFGSMLEYYDFVIFGLMATYVSHVMLKGQLICGHAGSIIFGIFFFSYLFRPLGMYAYSRWNNLKQSLKINNLVIALLFIASLSVALTPMDSILLSIICLIFARSLQGFARGAESQAEFDYLFHQLADKRGVAAFGLMAGAEIGVVFAMIINNFLTFLFNPNQMDQFGWRIPFYITCTLYGLIYVFRKLFQVSHKTKQAPQIMVPSYKIFRMYSNQVTFAILLSGLRASLAWLLILLIPLFLVQSLHSNYCYVGHLMLWASLSGVAGSFITMQYSIAQQAKNILPFALVSGLLSLWMLGLSISTNKYLIESLMLHGFISGVLAVLVIRVIFGFFPSSTRLSSISLCYSFGHTLVGGGVLLIIWLIVEIIHWNSPLIPIHIIFLYATIFSISILNIAILCLIKFVRNFNDYRIIIKQNQR